MAAYAFDQPGPAGKLKLPNGDILARHDGQDTSRYYTLMGPKGGIRHAFVELWVHGTRARNEEQFLNYLNGDAHDQSKCQLHAMKLHGPRFYDVTDN